MNDFGDYRIEGEESQYVGHIKSGALNQALIKRLTKISVSDDWEIAKHEWRATGQVWYRPLRYAETEIQQIPEPHCHDHPNKCVCGHPIAWHFEVENTENGILEILGSEHITNWMIVRHLKENKGIPADAITEEKIIEWMKEAVKTMKADWWWKENGEDWEEMFNHIKELDIRINVRSKGQYYDRETKRYEDHFTIAKTKSGSLGRMASVVWRWNHPDNSRRQIETRGYPNEKLWRDVRILFAKAQKFEQQLDEKMEEIEQRKSYVRQQEQERITMNEERRDNLKNEATKIRNETKIAYDTESMEEACAYYDIPVFNLDMASNEWERKFLSDMSNRIIRKQHLSVNQLNKLLSIISDEEEEDTEPATIKQTRYIAKLGGEVTDELTKSQASKLIGELLGGN